MKTKELKKYFTDSTFNKDIITIDKLDLSDYMDYNVQLIDLGYFDLEDINDVSIKELYVEIGLSIAIQMENDEILELNEEGELSYEQLENFGFDLVANTTGNFIYVGGAETLYYASLMEGE